MCVDVCNWMAASGVLTSHRYKFLVHFFKCYLAINRLNLNLNTLQYVMQYINPRNDCAALRKPKGIRTNS